MTLTKGTTMLGLEVPRPNNGTLRAPPAARIRFSPRRTGKKEHEVDDGSWDVVHAGTAREVGCPSASPVQAGSTHEGE